MERIGRARIVAAITSDTAVLTQASNMLCFSMQAPVLIFFVAIYVAYLSLAAFVLSVVIVGAAGTIFHFRNRRLTAERAKAAEQERRLFDRLTDFLDGFKEVRLNSARSNDLFDDAFDVSRTAANIKIRSQTETFKQIVSAQSYMYILLGAVVFVAPQFSDIARRRVDHEGHDGAAVRCRGVFRTGAIDTDPAERECRGGPHRPVGSRAAGDRCRRRTARLTVPKRFDKIEMHNIVFRYVDKFSDAAFQIGPHGLHLASRRAGLHHRRQRFGKIDVLAGALRALSARFRRSHARRDAHQRPHARRLSRVDVGDFLRLSSVPAALRHSRTGSGRGRPPADPIPVGRQDRRFRTASFARSIFPAASADVSRSSSVCSRSVRSCCWTNGRPNKIPNSGANSMTNSCRK